MLKLMKYELRKTAFSKLVLLVITAVAEIAFLIGVFWKKDNILAMGIIFLVMCTIFGVIYIGIESVNVLHRDLNTKQSYMLFLTPKSSYQILGAKILENGISIIMAGAFFAALAALDVTVATLYIGGLKEMINLVSSFMEVNWSVTFTPAEAAFYFFGLLASWTGISGFCWKQMEKWESTGKRVGNLFIKKRLIPKTDILVCTFFLWENIWKRQKVQTCRNPGKMESALH